MPCARSCELEMEVFQSLQDCLSGSTSDASGLIVADGTCRTAGSNNMLPGIYHAECQSSGKIIFLDSGCTSMDACQQSRDDEVCEGDNSVVSYIYARLANPVYPTDGTCFSTSYSNSQGVTLTATFKFVGPCRSDCVSGSIPPSGPSPTDSPSVQGQPTPTTPKPTETATHSPTSFSLYYY